MRQYRYYPPLLRFLRGRASALLLGVLFVWASADSALAQKTILFIYNPDVNDQSVDPNTGAVDNEDELILSIIEDDLGYEAVLVGMNEVTPADTAGVDAIFISESVGSGAVRDRFITVEGAPERGNYGLPIITSEVFVMDDLLWMRPQGGTANPTDVAHGFATSERINILPVDHPILGDLRQGPLDVYDDPPTGEPVNLVAYAVPNGEATILATVPGNALFNNAPIPQWEDTRASLFVYEEGDMIVDSDTLQIEAAARRVAFFSHIRGYENLNEEGQALLRNAIAWALGDEELIEDIDADPYRMLFIFNPDINDQSVDPATGAVDNEDELILSIIEDSLGYEAVLVGMNEVTPNDTADVDAIFISESVGSGAVRDRFITVEGAPERGNYGLPMMTSEVFVMDDLLWMPPQGPNNPTDAAHGFAVTDSIVVEDVDHPILGGVSPGELDIYDDPPTGEATNQVGYADPNGQATILATVPAEARFNNAPIPEWDDPRGTLFVYERGDSIVVSDTLDIVANERRVAFFGHTRGYENMNETGQALLINSLLWLTGREAEARDVEAIRTPNQGRPDVPSRFSIESVYPNPFNPAATVLLDVRQAGAYKVRVYDTLGRLVLQQSLTLAPGQVQLPLDLHQHPSGLYLIQVEHGLTGTKATARAMLLK